MEAVAGGEVRRPAPEMMTMSVELSEGHDDFLMSSVLVTEALSSFSALPESGYVVRPRRMDEGEGRY